MPLKCLTAAVSALLTTTAAIADDRSDVRRAFDHCRAAIEAKRPDAEMTLERHSGRGAMTYRFHLELTDEDGVEEEAVCTAHARRGVMRLVMDNDA